MADQTSRRSMLALLGFGAMAPIVAEDMASPVTMHPHGDQGRAAVDTGYHFGVSHKAIVSAIRNLADDIERGGSHAQNLELTSRITPEDFLMHTIKFEFAVDTRADADRRPIG